MKLKIFLCFLFIFDTLYVSLAKDEELMEIIKSRFDALERTYFVLTEKIEKMERKLDNINERISDQNIFRLEQKFVEVINMQKQTEHELKLKLNLIDNKIENKNTELATQMNGLGSEIVTEISNLQNNLQAKLLKNDALLMNLNRLDIAKNLTYVPRSNDWIVIQRRGINPNKTRISFARNFTEYVNGFGEDDGDFWIGLEKTHTWTSSGRAELKIILTYWNETVKYAEYKHFEVGDQQDNYRLIVCGYSGDAGDSLIQHNGYQFSTFDMDNDDDDESCSELYGRGGWWFYGCYHSYLNGPYKSGANVTTPTAGINWNAIRHDYSFKATEMMIKIT